ncbi:cysteine hydrolase family protein [Nocardioides ungokensis]|uniref:cysteine hydrolase family protein n=1 Tax=Nocardioides ungokensis TaxID=1643322 RepID=UPI0015DFAFC8|nr:cysteine hydrolase [Nocardioides ungokensis]
MGELRTATRNQVPWLVVIDLQRAFADPASGWATEGYRPAEKQVARLVEHFAGSVVFTRFVRDTNERGAWRQYYDKWPQFRVTPESSQWELTLDAPPGTPVVDESTFSKWGTQLRDLVGDAPLVLCGVATECCVLATAFAAADAGSHVTVASDACAGATRELHVAALRIMGTNSPLIDVTTVDVLMHADINSM